MAAAYYHLTSSLGRGVVARLCVRNVEDVDVIGRKEWGGPGSFGCRCRGGEGLNRDGCVGVRGGTRVHNRLHLPKPALPPFHAERGRVRRETTAKIIDAGGYCQF